jgi:hypothetical protein
MLLIGKVQNVIDAKIIRLFGLQGPKFCFPFERYFVVTDIYKFNYGISVCDLGI